MSDPIHATLSPALAGAIGRLYAPQSELTYFAGGHKWSDGVLYQFSRDGHSYILKLIPAADPGKTAALEERLRYQEYLGQAGIDVICPIHSERGNLIETVELGQPYAAFAWRKVEGEHIQLLDPVGLAGFYFSWGRLVGKIHLLAQAWPQWERSLAADEAGRALVSREREWQTFYEWIPDPEVKAAWLALKAELDALPLRRDNFGFIHNDPHPGNILVNGERLTLLDFDVSNYLWFITDLAICVYSEYSRCGFHSGYSHRVKELPELFIKPFLKGYRSQNALPREEFERLELFLNYRRFLMFTVFYEQIKTGDPVYLEKFKGHILNADRYLPLDILDLVEL